MEQVFTQMTMHTTPAQYASYHFSLIGICLHIILIYRHPRVCTTIHLQYER